MVGQHDDIIALRTALDTAERARDDARARLDAMLKQRRHELTAVQHHSRNTAAVVRAIIHRTAEEVVDVDEYCGLLDSRLMAYLTVQAAVTRDPDHGLNLEIMILDELLKFGIAGEDRILLTGPPVEFTARAAGLMVLAFHDILSDLIVRDFEWRADTLAISWIVDDRDDDRHLTIDCVEMCADGEPPSHQSPWTQSLRLAILHQLGGTTATGFAPGLRSTSIRLPPSCYLVGRSLDD